MEKFDYSTTVKVFDAEKHDGDWLPERLEDAIEWLQEKLSSVPEEFRERVMIEINSQTDYDSSIASMTIDYQRPPTADEIEGRRNAAVAFAERRVAQAKEQAEAAAAKLAQLGGSRS
jgi:hypothetical protein